MPFISQVSSANSTNTVTITPQGQSRVRVYRVDTFTSAGSCTLSITEAAATVFRSPAAQVTTTMTALEPRTAYEFAPGAAVTIVCSAAGGGNTSTINVQYELRQ